MNMKQLECFRAVMTSGTMTRAAALLGISQPAVSNLIATLEHELGFPLFRRSKQRIHPTPEAHQLHENVLRTLESFDRTVATGQQIRDGHLGNLVITTHPAISFDFLPGIVSRFLAKRPGVRVQLQTRSSQIVRELIPAQQFDIALSELPVDHPAVRTEAYSFPCVCALPPGHPLTALETISVRDLDGVPFISLFREHMTYGSLAKTFAANECHWNVVAETQFFAIACTFVLNGAGVCLVEPITARQYQRMGLVLRPFEPEIRYDIGLLYPIDRQQSLLAKELTQIIREELTAIASP